MFTVVAFFWVVPVLFLIFASAFALVGWHSSGTKGARLAAIGFGAACLGSVFDTQRSYLPEFMSWLATPAHWIAIYCLASSMLVRKGQAFAKLPIAAWATVSVLLHTYLIISEAPLTSRILLMNISVPILMSLAIPPLLKACTQMIDKVMVALIIACVATYPVRLLIFFTQSQSSEVIGPWTWSQYIIVFYLVMALLGVLTALAIMFATGMDIIAKHHAASAIDPLTGIGNRRALDRWIEYDAGHGPKYCAAIMIDLDRFKLINDNFGHAAGDVVLISVAQELAAKIGVAADIARFGGDEFVALLHNENQNAAAFLTMTTREAITKLTFPAPYTALQITASVGLAIRSKGQELRALINQADKAAYDAKSKGRDAAIGADLIEGSCVTRAVA